MSSYVVKFYKFIMIAVFGTAIVFSSTACDDNSSSDVKNSDSSSTYGDDDDMTGMQLNPNNGSISFYDGSGIPF